MNDSNISPGADAKFNTCDSVWWRGSAYRISRRELSRSGWIYNLIWGGEVHERELTLKRAFSTQGSANG